MTLKRMLSLLLACCLIMGAVPTVTLAADPAQVVNCKVPEGYHLLQALPTAEHPEITGNLYLGGAFEKDEPTVLYGMSSTFSSNAATTSTDAAAQSTVTIHYGGTDDTYGDYYYVVFRLPSNGNSYTFAYAGGYFTQNMIQDTGTPSGGWAYKHRLYFDGEGQFFYHRVETSLSTTKGLKISSASYKIFTETVANLKKNSDAYCPVRVYELCASNNAAGYDETHHWSGTCACGKKFDETAHDQVADWNVINAEGHGKACSCGYALEAVAEHNLSAAWQTDPESGLEYTLCETCGYKVTKEHTHLFGDEWESDAESHWKECACGEKNDAAAHTFGSWTEVKKPVTLADKGSEKRTCEICQYSETRETTLSVEDFKVLTTAPKADVPFYLGATQLQVENTPTYFFKGVWAPSKYQTMDVTTNMVNAAPMYAEAVTGGYKLYFADNGVKTYLILANMTVSEQLGVFVQKAASAEEASVFVWNDEYDTFLTTVEGKGDYYIGNYTSGSTNYTKLSALLASGLGRDDRHPAKLYSQISGEDSHEHTFGEWVVVTVPAHLQDQGRDERTCEVCGYVEVRHTTLHAEDFAASTNPPPAGAPFYLGATQLQVENTPTYFFKGVWAPSKYQAMDVTTNMEAATPLYAEVAEGGYKLYFVDNGAKTYLILDNMTVSEQEGVFVQPVADGQKASVFIWNSEYNTFQTMVTGKGTYYIGNYTNKETNYTKLSALLVSGLGRDDRHPGKIYVKTSGQPDHEHTFGEWEVKTRPTTLQDQGIEERVCTICGYVEVHTTMLSAKDYAPAACPPPAGVGFYLGATQRQAEGRPTCFFKGNWAPSKYLNMDVSTSMEKAALMYAEQVAGGYKLYFEDKGVKTYLCLGQMTVNGSKGVFVQPVTDVNKATVFTWNYSYYTFQTNVPGKGAYYIGNYSHNGTNYTKLSALLVSGLGRADRHAAKVYVPKYLNLGSPNTGDYFPMTGLVVTMVMSMTAMAALVVVRKKKLI